ncbi:UDP-N-acetylglucosamine 2-epimerase [Paraburkholderia caffeinitolerans]|uniref:UDP-N-acetylglucosamine 2-epimerase (non-hydrolyzing) n=2 Tax=Paraburkholderia TaxID=1822464 RepID=A0A6J5G9R2_9BURK|nr:UDP-N-acetylglucosamine 2-epimerase (non-hydrolyzing) [Paraburkholderia caffeinitolerans]CAB3795864.1 UDP-N-acetylglucosamine 2-epimerase [Paraburkholderia caffeinitolerans]
MRILSIFGTRPEAIKMAPLVKCLEAEHGVQSLVCVTGQHQSMLQQVLDLFDITPDYNLAAMTANQSLNGLTSRLFAGLDDVLAEVAPDRVLVHGDTATSMVAAIAAFHRRIPVGHVEAGLRTGNMFEPWPEEMNRRVVDVVADQLFAPTASSQANLEAEALTGHIVVTGNTVIDALRLMCARLDSDEAMRTRIDAQFPFLEPEGTGRPLLLVTGHRRESFGEGFQQICAALAALAQTGKMQIVYPVHLNPNVRGPVLETLGNAPNVHLTDPLDYPEFVRLMQRAAIVLTDSGGVQEEAPALGKPVLVMRDVTERPEALAAGTVKLIGTDRDAIYNAVLELAVDESARSAYARRVNPYGDGHASERIVASLVGKPFTPFASHSLPGYAHPVLAARPDEQ